MATKRQGAGKGTGRRKATGARRRRAATRRQRRPDQRTSGAREARAPQAALELERSGPRLVPPPGVVPDEPAPSAERAGDGQWGAAASEAAEGSLAEPGRVGRGRFPLDRAAEAQSELSRRREEQETAYRQEQPSEFPGLSAIAIEIAIGALRLARTIVTAPFRLTLAFLRGREA
jgi:hypothetical protein